MQRGAKNKLIKNKESQKGGLKCTIVSVQELGLPQSPGSFTGRLNREKLCVVCLSRSSLRKMYPLEDTRLFYSITTIKLRTGSMVCWECNAVLQKIKEFKDKALKAHSIFSTCLDTTPSSLSTLVENNLLNWVSITFKPLIEINPLNPTDTNDISLKEESDESEILTSEPQDLNLTDPFSLHSEVEIKEEDELGCTVIKCDYASHSSDDEPLVNTVKAKQAYIKMTDMAEDSSDTDSASECTGLSPRISNPRTDLPVPNLPTKTQSPLQVTYDISSISPPLIQEHTKYLTIPPPSLPNKTIIPPSLNLNVPKFLPTPQSLNSNSPKSSPGPLSLNPNMSKSLPTPPSLNPNMLKSLLTPPSLNSNMSKSLPLELVELPIAFVASSILTNSLRTPENQEESTSQKKDGPVAYHSGTKLFKNSPQLTIPKMFQAAVEAPPSAEPTWANYEIRRLSDEEIVEYRAKRLKTAKDRLWQNFCTKCLYKFLKHQDYLDHFKNHDQAAGQFVCNICELRYPTQRELDVHKEDHYKEYICVKCNDKFYCIEKFKKHNYLVHDIMVKYCRHCDQKFTNKKEYYMHNRTHLKVVKCKFCDKEMKSNKLTQHVKERHEPQPFLECEICHKVVQGKSRLHSHMKYMHKQKEIGYCVECDASFKTQSLYMTHLNTSLRHCGADDKFSCAQCPRSFARPWQLNKHVKVMHEHGEQSQCDICQKVYPSKKAIRAHIMSFHLKMKTASQRRDKICDICGKAFWIKACLEQHVNSHLNIRPFKCEYCDATFSYSGARYTHIRLKHRKKQAKPKI